MELVNAPTSPANPSGRRKADAPFDIPRDRWQRPLIVPPGGGSPIGYTRASTLGGTLEDQTNIGEWKKRVVAFGMARRRDLVLAAASCETWDARADKRLLADIAEQAMQAAEANAAATIGTALHALTERLDRGEPIPDVGDDQRALDAYAALMRSFTVHAIETFVVCDDHQVAGTFDRLMSSTVPLLAPDGTRIEPGERLIGDIKTSGSDAFFGIKFASQCAEYSHGIPYHPERGRESWPDGLAPRTDWGLIMHVPSGGSTAALYWVDLVAGRELSDLACVVREWRKRKDLVVKAADPVDLHARIAATSTRAECLALWAEHKDVWTPEHTAAVEAHLAQRTVAS